MLELLDPANPEDFAKILKARQDRAREEGRKCPEEYHEHLRQAFFAICEKCGKNLSKE